MNNKISLAIVGIIAVIAAAYIIISAKKPSNSATPPGSGVAINVPINTPPTPPQNTPEVKGTFSAYTSQKGFSIEVPKQLEIDYGSCTWNAAENSYRPGSGIVPYKVFEDSSAAYIAPAYYYKLGGETVKNNISYFSKCDKTNTTLSILKNPNTFEIAAWAISIKPAKTDTELTTLIRNQFGKTCSIGNKTASTQKGVFDVTILGDGKDLSETGCPINYQYSVKYYPDKGLVAMWGRGQSCYYGQSTTCFDEEMNNSFRFQ